MEFHGIPWNSIKFRGSPWSSPSISMEFHGISMECPLSSIEFHAVCMGIHRNSLIKQLINRLTACSSLNFLLDRKIEKKAGF